MHDPLPEALLGRVAERFRVLGDATRLSILRLLLSGEELNVGEIAARLSASQANVSKHLRILHGAGVIARKAEGTAAYYRISDPSLEQLCEMVCGRIRQQVGEEARTISLA
jgi:DNA-binding transcriptional ArsR family regulator